MTLPGSGGTVSFKYDPFGRRIQKVFTQNSTTTTTDYAYDGDDTIEETDQNGNLLAKYARTENIDEPLAESRSGTLSYYEADGLGSITSLTSSVGAIANSYTYDSYGKLTNSSGSLMNPFRYTSREFDTETNLYFYRARYHDPMAGRFLTEDPEGFSAGPDFYVYTGNNPLNWIDPEGLRKVFVCRQSLKASGGALKFFCHTYIKITEDDGTFIASFGVLGDKGTRKNQIPRKNDTERNNGTDCRPVGGACEPNIDSLLESLQRSFDSKTCPSCGGNYRAWKPIFDDYNSNTYTYNMLLGAGMKPPKERRCPGYHEAPPKSGSWN